MIEPLAVLLLPSRLEDFEFAGHARDLLSIPRVVALEPSRRRTPRLLRDAAPVHQAKRVRLPGEPLMLILYHPSQYPLARALCARYGRAELWYVSPESATLGGGAGYSPEELRDLDQLARERAVRTVPIDGTEVVRVRLRELQIISSRPFVPAGRVEASRGRL